MKVICLWAVWRKYLFQTGCVGGDNISEETWLRWVSRQERVWQEEHPGRDMEKPKLRIEKKSSVFLNQQGGQCERRREGKNTRNGWRQSQTVQNTVGGAYESLFYSKSEDNYLWVLQPDLQF